VGALASPALALLNGGFELCLGPPPQHYEGNRDQRGEDRPGQHWQEGRWERLSQNNHDVPDRWTPGRWEPDHKDNMMNRGNDNRRNDSRMDNNQRDSQGDEQKSASRRGNDRG